MATQLGQPPRPTSRLPPPTCTTHRPPCRSTPLPSHPFSARMRPAHPPQHTGPPLRSLPQCPPTQARPTPAPCSPHSMATATTPRPNPPCWPMKPTTRLPPPDPVMPPSRNRPRPRSCTGRHHRGNITRTDCLIRLSPTTNRSLPMPVPTTRAQPDYRSSRGGETATAAISSSIDTAHKDQ